MGSQYDRLDPPATLFDTETACRELTVDSAVCPSEMRKAELLVISRLCGLSVFDTVPW